MVGIKSINRQKTASVLFGTVTLLLTCAAFGQNPDPDQEVTKGTGDAQWRKENNLIGYSVTETYSVFRNGGSQPAATRVVRTVYKKGEGKRSSDISRTGSSAIQTLLLNKILSGEEEISQNDKRKGLLITSDNYAMKVAAEEKDTIPGRKCLVLELKPKTKSPYLLDGRAWVDSQTYELVKIEGKPSERPSFWSGRPLITREYHDAGGFPLATHARAESNSLIFGKTVVVIEYTDYKIDAAP